MISIGSSAAQRAEADRQIAIAKDRGQGLPQDNKARKDTPMFSGCIRYFPLALAAVARLSKAGNDKHNPGEPLHWSRGKSNDHMDCAQRHMAEYEKLDPETGEFHLTAATWRLLAQLQLLEEQRS